MLNKSYISSVYHYFSRKEVIYQVKLLSVYSMTWLFFINYSIWSLFSFSHSNCIWTLEPFLLLVPFTPNVLFFEKNSFKTRLLHFFQSVLKSVTKTQENHANIIIYGIKWHIGQIFLLQLRFVVYITFFSSLCDSFFDQKIWNKEPASL